ncbi:hypothetical protein FRC04_004837, partial [Tulasnella sp. 424]
MRGSYLTSPVPSLERPAPDVRPPVFPDIPVRRPLVGVYEWLAIEAALLESEDEDWSDDSDDDSDDDTVSKEEIRVRRYRPGVSFDLPGDEEAAMSADESVGHQTPPRSPVASLGKSSHQRLRPPSLRPRFSSPYDSDAEDSPVPRPLARQSSPLATGPISFMPRASPSPSPPPPTPPPPPPPPEPVQEFPLTLPDDLATQ